MKNKIMKMLIICLAVMSCSVLCAFDKDGQKVFDAGSYLTSEEEEEITEKLCEAAEELSLDLIVYITDSTNGQSVYDAAQDVYMNHGFGYDRENGDGLMLMIDMGERNFCVHESATDGHDMHYTDNELDYMVTALTPYLSDGDFYGVSIKFISLAKQYADYDQEGDDSYDGELDYDTLDDYDEKVSWSARLIASAIIGGIAVLIMHHKQKARKVTNPHVYMKTKNVKVLERSDMYTHTTTTKRRVDSDSGGGSHGSSHSSGGSHHSGGGSFSHSRGGHF